MKINGYDINYDEAELKDKMENQTLDVRLISPDFEGYKNLSEGNKKALAHLVAAARMVNDVALEQDHPMNLPQKKALAEAAAAGSSHAALALELFNSLNGVAGYNGVDKEPVEVFAGIRLLPGHNFYPADLSPEEFRQILIAMLKAGKSEEVRKILSARTMVRRAGGELKAIDYTEYFAAAFSAIANELEVAAHYADDEAFKDYLGWQAQALLQNNPDMDMLADRHWAVLQDTPLEFTLSRENYDDEITPAVYDNGELKALLAENGIEAVGKDTLGARVGIVNKAGTDLILQFKKHPSWRPKCRLPTLIARAFSTAKSLNKRWSTSTWPIWKATMPNAAAASPPPRTCPTTTSCRSRPAAAGATSITVRCG